MISPEMSPRASPQGSPDFGNPATFAGIFGQSNLAFDFDCRYRSAAGIWVDRARRLSVVSPGTPTAYAADGLHFGGMRVHQCAVAGSAGLAVLTPDPPIWPAGSRPYIMGVARFRSYPVGFNILVKIANLPTTTNSLILITGSGTQLVGSSESSGNATATFSDTTAPHIFELYEDSSGVLRFEIDGVLVGSVGTGLSLTTATGHLSFGGNQIASANMSDTSHAGWWGCYSVPADERRAAARALAHSAFKF